MAYTTIDDPSAHFITTLHTGDGTSPKSITNSANSGDFQPDLIWAKGRSTAYEHQLSDSSRGTSSSNGLASNTSNAEGFFSSTYGYVSSFDSNGFTATAGSAGGPPYYHNASGTTYVFWQWKANGGTTSSNTDGTLTSTVQANTDAGFSIVTYTNPATGNKTVGHGLGVKPAMIIFKNLDASIDWHVAHKDLNNYTTYGLTLNTAGSQAIYTNAMNATEPTSSVFSIGGVDRTGSNGNEVVAYCFAEKQGYSKFGKYTGNGNANGAFVYTGFRPAFVLLKSISSSSHNWFIFDSKRGVNGAIEEFARPNSNGATTSVDDTMDILSNGFKIRTNYANVNTNTHEYIYMALAENPFVTSTGIPTTAR